MSIRKEAIHTVPYAFYSMLSMFCLQENLDLRVKKSAERTRPEIREKLSPHLLTDVPGLAGFLYRPHRDLQSIHQQVKGRKGRTIRKVFTIHVIPVYKYSCMNVAFVVKEIT